MKPIIARASVLAALLACACEQPLLGPSVSPPLPVVHATAFATLLDSLRYALHLPALASAIVTDDSILEADAVGSRRYAGPMNVTPNDQFHLGSDTKAMTAALLGVLVDDGLVSWTTTLAEIFPEYASSMRVGYAFAFASADVPLDLRLYANSPDGRLPVAVGRPRGRALPSTP